MTFVNLNLTKEDGIGILTINRPEALNALNRELLNELKEAIAQIKDDPEIKVCIITGEGKAFVAGADIGEMVEFNAVEGREFGRLGNSVFNALEEMEKPVIAAINGYALGGGCELALACDIRLASEKAKLGQPEVGLGITPGFGGTQRLVRAIGPAKAKELIFTGKIIDANEAHAIGLVNHVYPAESLLEEAKKMAREIANKAPFAVKLCKRAINEGMEMDLKRGLEMEADLFGLCFATEDQKEGMRAFLEKRKAEFKGE
ncbi:crotonase [Anoxybacter fermentans]|uniref:short-chain-enoyl-CoA hydratase n=1 Tax=Anoxybacter fermentans TaxID=1323375 RepID=A0A3Q9HS35_9FIRM|nr:short-chain-enoyl-CoA hydratase [Anoxybacter fermentans]AZR74058.1 crotonase [Anoxybacter fermentans]